MPHVDRFSVSLDTELLAAFDRYLADRGYQNRSEAVRDLIRDRLAEARLASGDSPAAAFLTLVCDHREGEIAKRLRFALREAGDVVVGSYWVSLDAERDGVAIALRGPADRIRSLAHQIQAMRGIQHTQLATSVPTAE